MKSFGGKRLNLGPEGGPGWEEGGVLGRQAVDLVGEGVDEDAVSVGENDLCHGERAAGGQEQDTDGDDAVGPEEDLVAEDEEANAERKVLVRYWARVKDGVLYYFMMTFIF